MTGCGLRGQVTSVPVCHVGRAPPRMLALAASCARPLAHSLAQAASCAQPQPLAHAIVSVPPRRNLRAAISPRDARRVTCPALVSRILWLLTPSLTQQTPGINSVLVGRPHPNSIVQSWPMWAGHRAIWRKQLTALTPFGCPHGRDSSHLAQSVNYAHPLVHCEGGARSPVRTFMHVECCTYSIALEAQAATLSSSAEVILHSNTVSGPLPSKDMSDRRPSFMPPGASC
ncbi:putative peroxidase 18 [Iris pallida]|uniref:Peroxidase 18 n=1 Tax=Iris pallida TaxID=29817 RepID=A0AAX6GZT3_IRIPA|nr:putative peroxidase 18 [Iris pallida]